MFTLRCFLFLLELYRSQFSNRLPQILPQSTIDFKLLYSTTPIVLRYSRSYSSTPLALRYSKPKSNTKSKVRNLNHGIEVHDGAEYIPNRIYISNDTIMQFSIVWVQYGVRPGVPEYHWKYTEYRSVVSPLVVSVVQFLCKCQFIFLNAKYVVYIYDTIKESLNNHVTNKKMNSIVQYSSEVPGHAKIQVKFSRFSWNFYHR